MAQNKEQSFEEYLQENVERMKSEPKEKIHFYSSEEAKEYTERILDGLLKTVI